MPFNTFNKSELQLSDIEVFGLALALSIASWVVEKHNLKQQQNYLKKQ